MSIKNDPDGYYYDDADHNASHGYLLPTIETELSQYKTARIFDLGCGNGSVAKRLNDLGWAVTGIDPSQKGIDQAMQKYPELNLHAGSAYEDLHQKFGTFPVVVSLEVVEHLYEPRKFATTAFELLEPGGRLLLSTPYHGYLKNLVLALSGKMDAHFTALWDHGHIKFWSEKTISILLREAGFVNLRISRVGRLRPIAKSMIVVAQKPS